MNRLAPFILLAAAGWALWGVAKPQYELVDNLKARIVERTNTLQTVEKITERKNILLAEYASVDEQRSGQLNLLMPARVDSVRLSIDISSRILNYGLTIKEVRAKGRSEPKPKEQQQSGGQAASGEAALAFEPVPLQFTLEGPYEAFVALLADLEKSMHIIDLTALDIKVSDKGEYTYDITFTAYQFTE